MILDSCGVAGDLVNFINETVSTPLKILAVVLFLVFTSIEYAKVVFSGDGSFKKANQNSLKRFIALLILFFAPDIINLILGWVDLASCKI
ncbi:MAG: hypothetical protein J6X02_05155 [Bacilli bacterium]|nr:hypothetical protein [Bacilli bacterium]